MKYDSVKDIIARIIGFLPPLRKMFYSVLDLQILRHWYIKRKIRKNFSREKKIEYYDAGAGMGQFSYFILNKYEKSRVFAVDLKDDYLQSFKHFAKKEGFRNYSYKTADLQEFTPAKKYDLITAIDILEHIENDLQVLKNFRKCLKPGGKLIISSPSNFDKSAQFIEEHFRPGYSKQEMISKLSAAGFRIVTIDYMYGFFGHIYWQLIMKIPLALLDKNKLFALILPLYYLIFYPFGFLMMIMDFVSSVRKGTGLLVVAE